MDNLGNDCNWNGWPHWDTYAIGMHNVAVGDPQQRANESAVAEGLIGGV